MHENTFFRTVWRINAFVLLFIGIVGLVLLLFGGYELYREKTRTRTISDTITLPKTSNPIKQTHHFGYAQQVPKTPYIMIQLEVNQNYRMSHYDKTADSTCNYLFVDTHTQASKWLLKTSKNLIVRNITLQHNDSETLAILYTIVAHDTNRDGRLSHQDDVVIGISRPDGTHYTELLHNVHKLIHEAVVSDHQLFLLYETNGTAYSTQVSLSDFSTTPSSALLPTP